MLLLHQLKSCSAFWTVIIAMDSTLAEQNHDKIYEFIQHCCYSSHYTFDIRKCCEDACTLCKPVRLPREVFTTIKHLPLPKPGQDGHYLPLCDVLGTTITEEHRPSLQKKLLSIRKPS